MPAVLLSVVASMIIGGVVWLILGSRIQLRDHTTANDAANYGAYCLAVFLPVFVFVFYVIELI